MNVIIETMCIALDPGPYLKGQGPTGQLKVRICHARVRTITYLCIDGIPYNLVQMFSYLRRCAVTLTRVYTTKQTNCSGKGGRIRGQVFLSWVVLIKYIIVKSFKIIFGTNLLQHLYTYMLNMCNRTLKYIV